jgi:hypothetical protein
VMLKVAGAECSADECIGCGRLLTGSISPICSSALARARYAGAVCQADG